MTFVKPETPPEQSDFFRADIAALDAVQSVLEDNANLRKTIANRRGLEMMILLQCALRQLQFGPPERIDFDHDCNKVVEAIKRNELGIDSSGTVLLCRDDRVMALTRENIKPCKSNTPTE